MNYSLRPGIPSDVPGIEKLLPRLAEFDVPDHRNPDHLWQGDVAMVRDWGLGNRPEVHVIVATVSGAIAGVAVVSERSELLSGEPSLHLEVLAIDSACEGIGIGSALMRETDLIAAEKGVDSISLHVFSANTRARALYERHGYSGELIRYLKPVVHTPISPASQSDE